MAAKRRHWKEKQGRFWARISIPATLRPCFGGKTELSEPLGGDRRIADRNHAAAVARLQEQIAAARRTLEPTPALPFPQDTFAPMTTADCKRAVWDHHSSTLERYEQRRASLPTLEAMTAEYGRLMKRIDAGEIDGGRDVIGMINAYADYEAMVSAREDDRNLRARRLTVLRAALGSDDARPVEHLLDAFVATNRLALEQGSRAWHDLANRLLRAEITALELTLERDQGSYSGQVKDPIIEPPDDLAANTGPVPLRPLFEKYIAKKQVIGKHRDGGANWTFAIQELIKFLGHEDAARITKRNLLDWRDALLAAGKSPKTVSNKYLAAIRAVLKWAFEDERLPTNEGATVTQEVPRKVQTRERGYTTPEAIRILKASLAHQPAEVANPSNRESAHITAAKRWLPLLSAFTGARITELSQLRKEDLRREGERWILRITPEAGSVKTGQFRDVPLHRQVVQLGFAAFVEAASPGPLFHGAKTPDKYLAGARMTSGRISEWLNALGVVPANVQPSYGWRHRFKTLGRELGASDRVLDAIQGHAGRTASDDYGDVTINARLRVIDALPDYDLTDTGTGAHALPENT